MVVDMVGYYNLDEPGEYDDAVDSAGIMGNLIASGGELSSTSGPGSHSARNFSDGRSLTQLVNFSSFSGVPFSINFWIFQNSNGGQYTFDCSGGVAQGFSCFLASDAPYVNLYSFNGGDYNSPGTITTSGTVGEWVMFTLVWTETDYFYYENGALIATDAFSQPGFDVDVTPFCISPAFLPVDGAMALFGLWGRALDGTEVGQLYNGGDGLSFAELETL